VKLSTINERGCAFGGAVFAHVVITFVGDWWSGDKCGPVQKL
jgi:hypothetical protein